MDKSRITDKEIYNVIEILLVIVFFIAAFNRVRYGIEFSDESWYIAEPMEVVKGAVPVADMWTQAPGFTIPLSLFYHFFYMVNGSTEGIVLFQGLYLCVGQ